MRHTLTLLSFAALATVHGQITIGPADMPSAGDTMRYRTTAAMGVDLDLTGPDVTWDFGSLTPDVEGADTALAVSATPFAYQLFFNNPFLYPQHDADLAMKGQDFGFQSFLTVSNLYDYYKKDATGYRNVGFGANINGLPTSTRRIPVDYIHRFPMAFGDEDTSFSNFELSVPTVFSFEQDQWRYNTVDGWGTLYLPADTFQVLRVRSVLQRSDTIFVNQFNFGFRLDEPETVEYRWIAQGMDAPVLLVTTVAGQPTTARFYYDPEEIITGIGSAAISHAPVLFPNPADGSFRLQLPADHSGVLDLLDAAGRVVRGGMVVRGGGSILVNVEDLANGVYTARLTGARPWTGQVVVRH